MASTMRFFAERWICGVLCHTILLHPQGDGTPWVCSRGSDIPALWYSSCWSCTNTANSGWECSTLLGFGGDDDFYTLCIGIHINQAVKKDEVFGRTAQIWVVDGINMKGHIIHPQEIKVNPMVSSEAATATSTEQHVASNSCQLPIYRVILWYNNPYHFLTAWVEASISTGRIAEGWNWER